MLGSESETRAQKIDGQLACAGWNVGDASQVVMEYEIRLRKDPDQIQETTPGYGEVQYSDYVLLGKNGKPLAVVEAKRTSKDPAIDLYPK
jgi:type I restriction enzyme, R subunit